VYNYIYFVDKIGILVRGVHALWWTMNEGSAPCIHFIRACMHVHRAESRIRTHAETDDDDGGEKDDESRQLRPDRSPFMSADALRMTTKCCHGNQRP
jgi:hypothetical protein